MENPYKDKKLFLAPLQGYTEAPYRRFHAEVYGHDVFNGYITPFLRVERGAVRARDLRDVTSPLNEGMENLSAQVIFKDQHELKILVDTVYQEGCRRVNLNLGCPFPPQWKKGRGAAMVERTDELRRAAELLASYDGLKVNVKMRLGVDDPKGWCKSIDVLNAMPLEWVAVHPRTAEQEYSGDVNLGEFARFQKACVHKVIFNGDLATAEDIDGLFERFPDIYGAMIGRGVLARPSLPVEWRSGREMDREERLTKIRALHDRLFSYYEGRLCGDAQLIAKMKPFWDYLEGEIGRKCWKGFHKAQSIGKYRLALAEIGS